MAFHFNPALIGALREGYTRKTFLADLGAGALVGVVALPLGMAFAIASGCKPEQGLFTAIVAGIAISVLGGSRMQIGGPTGAFVSICAAAVATVGYGGLAIATLMAGVLIFLMGVLRLGKAITYIPIPVIIGFTSGIAVVIASTQLKEALGVSFVGENPKDFVERMAAVWHHLSSWRPAAAALCVGTVALILIIRRISIKLPAALIALIVLSLVAWASGLEVETVFSRFKNADGIAIPRSLPVPSLPSLGLGENWTMFEAFAKLRGLFMLACQIALLGAIESLLSAVVADGMSKGRHDSNTELMAQGIANLLSPLFGGLPATGAIARTATNIRAGARTPVAGIIHALVLLAIVLVAAPLVELVPLSCLAGVLLVVCWNMAEVRLWPRILRGHRADAVLLPLTFLLTVLVDLNVAIVVGVVLGMFFFVQRMSDAVQIETWDANSDGASGGDAAVEKLPAGIEVYEVRGPFYFGVATMIRDLLDGVGARPRVLILRIRHVPFIDTTAGFAIEELLGRCRAKGIALLLAEVNEAPMTTLRRGKLIEELGADRVFPDFAGALALAKTLAAPPAL